MILKLRQRHRRMFAVIGVLLPLAFVVGLSARRAVPQVDALPTALVRTQPTFSKVEWDRSDLFPKSPVQVQLLREREGVGGYAIACAATKDFVKPDLIVYWVAGNPNITDTLPENAVLLGAFSSASLRLPAESARSGVLVLFSLADNEVVDASKPITF